MKILALLVNGLRGSHDTPFFAVATKSDGRKAKVFAVTHRLSGYRAAVPHDPQRPHPRLSFSLPHWAVESSIAGNTPYL